MLLQSAELGRVDQVAALLDQGVDIQCKDQVRVRVGSARLATGNGQKSEMSKSSHHLIDFSPTVLLHFDYIHSIYALTSHPVVL